jgi:hypothetical protein
MPGEKNVVLGTYHQPCSCQWSPPVLTALHFPHALYWYIPCDTFSKQVTASVDVIKHLLRCLFDSQRCAGGRYPKGVTGNKYLWTFSKFCKVVILSGNYRLALGVGLLCSPVSRYRKHGQLNCSGRRQTVFVRQNQELGTIIIITIALRAEIRPLEGANVRCVGCIWTASRLCPLCFNAA